MLQNYLEKENDAKDKDKDKVKDKANIFENPVAEQANKVTRQEVLFKIKIFI